ncbi:MAG: VOC family protein [Hyphomicrobiaceae bacterium]
MTATSRSSSDDTAPALRYRDLDKAIEWLCATFDFEVHSVVRGKDGRLDYAELSFANDTLLLGSMRNEESDGLAAKSDQFGRSEVQSCYLLVDDINALRVKAAQARLDIVFDIKADKFVGRSFGCKDLEGHIWYFGSSTSPPEKPRSKLGLATQPFASLVFGFLVFTIGFSGWLYVNADSVDDRIAIPVDEPAKTMRAEISKAVPLQRRALREASELALLAKEEHEALEYREAAIRKAKMKLAGNVAKNAETVDQPKRKIDERNAKLPSNAGHLSKTPVPQLVRPRQAINKSERVIVEQRSAGKTTKLAAKEKTQLEPHKRAYSAATAAIQQTRLLLAKIRERRIAAQPSIVGLAAAVAVRTESLNRLPSRPRAPSSVSDIGPGLNAPERPAELPTAVTVLEIPSPGTAVDKTAGETQQHSRLKRAALPSEPRVQSRTPEKQKTPAPIANRERSTAIENARRLAEKLRKRQAARVQRPPGETDRDGGGPNQAQPDPADSGLTTGKAIKPEDILRRAFIAEW